MFERKGLSLGRSQFGVAGNSVWHLAEPVQPVWGPGGRSSSAGMFSLAVGALASVVAAGTAVAVLAGLWVGVLVMVCGPAMETAPNDTMQVGLYITVLGGSLMAIGAGIMFPEGSPGS